MCVLLDLPHGGLVPLTIFGKVLMGFFFVLMQSGC